MMAKVQGTRPETLTVRLGDCLVGTLTRLNDETIIFAFDPSYESNSQRPILSLSFKGEGGALYNARSRTHTWLSPFFSNLLPEGHLREYLARKLEINSQREFYLLAGLGADLPGAVVVEQLGEWSSVVKPAPLVDVDRQSSVLRFSLAGVQLKFSAILQSKGAFTIPAGGTGGSWIVKLPSANHLLLPEVEFSMLTFASKIGIDVPEFKLVPASSIKGLPAEFRATGANSLAVKRFDRTTHGGRVHMEDFAQVFNIEAKDKYEKAGYAHIAKVLWMEDGEASFCEFIRRLVFTVAIGNGDMHLKNWSVLYTDPCKPVLSPAYDFVPTIAYIENDSLALNLGGTKQFNEVTVDKFKKLARLAKASERLVTAVVSEAVERIQETWQEDRLNLGLPIKAQKAIEKHMAGLVLLNGR
ncbi:HipA domain-containing protein [soil metagenome]